MKTSLRGPGKSRKTVAILTPPTADVPAFTAGRPPRVIQFFDRARDARPAATALVCGAEQFRYDTLEARANQLARYLLRYGVGPGARVGLLLERSVHTYVALLAALRCGAAFVPLDPSFPAERVAFIAHDASLDVLVTTADFGPAVSAALCPVLALDTARAAVAAEPAARFTVQESGDALAYIIYTSGTTGHPKGVAVNHSSLCNFLNACVPIYDVTARDRVYQGMTLSFDFSVEEVWPTFVAGATLVAGPTDHRRLGAGLNDFLIDQRVSVLCCVPTLLATLERDVPTLRTLLVGGEACPADLVKRWHRPGRRMLNTYGPTETTVTATWTELVPDRPVTIGKPLPTYTAHILDEQLRPVPPGQTGEICLGGPGVAVGYVNRPELTAEKFVRDPFSDRPGARLYRTGDLGRVTFDDEIEYLGRIDTQVKVRGYRIELAEIEAILLEDPAVANALVALVEVEGTVKELAAYVSARGTADAYDLRDRLHDALRSRLPAYMVPAFIELLDVFPMLPSGKADRSRLPPPVLPRLGGRTGDCVPPATPLECLVHAAWVKVFGRDDVSVEDDFFLDLNGHSLVAALVVSDLRRNPALGHLGIGDLYSHPTIRGLVRHIETTARKFRPAAARARAWPRPAAPRRASDRRVLACGLAQVALLYLTWALLTAPAAVVLGGGPLTAGRYAAILLLTLAVLPVSGLLLPVAAKWLLVGRCRPGRYPLWGWYYCRWWLVRKLLQLAPLESLAGSPLLAPYLRLLGGRVGRGCHLGTGRLELADLIEIGDGASLGYGADLEPFLVEDGWLYLEPLRIGAGAFVGANAVVMAGGRVGDGARLAEQSLVARGQTIPDGETWAGSPSRRVAADPQLEALAAATPPGRWTPALLAGFVLGMVLLTLLPTLASLPALLLLYVLSGADLVWALAWTPAAGLAFVLTTCAAVATGKWALMSRARPGVYPLRSAFGLRKWLADKLMLTSLTLTNSLYATLYALPWLRLLGARIGPRSEVSTVSNIDPDLLTLGTESFVADLAVIGAARHFRGQIALGAAEVGARSFVGNAALVPGGTVLADGCLIGVLSVPPTHPVEPGTSWLGQPAIFLPRRQSSGRFDEAVTFYPPTRLVACRLAIECLRVTLPATLSFALLLLMALCLPAFVALPAAARILALPLAYLGPALLVLAAVAALKWLVVGRYRPRVEPLWSHFVWRTELITALYENVTAPTLLRWLTGTPWAAPLLRLFGARIGRRVYLETTFLTEFDLVHVGDEAMVAGLTSLQTHLFEDRVMKMSTVTIGPGCTVGPRSVVLYDAALDAGAELAALSLVMKGESLPAGTRWCGIPARLAD